MAEVKVYYDQVGNTLTVWFGNPHDEYTSEETGDEVILMKDRNGQVIGFEKLNYSIPLTGDNALTKDAALGIAPENHAEKRAIYGV